MISLYKFIARLPLWVLHRLSTGAYLVIYYLVRYRRDTVADNLRHAFPEKSDSERRAIEKAFYRGMCDTAFEVIKGLRLSPQALEQRVTLHNTQCLQPYLDRGESVLVLAAHKGNWEWAQLRFAASLPCPLYGVYKPLHNQAFDELMLTMRTHFNGRMIPFKDAAREMLRRRHDRNVFVMAADQAPAHKDKRYWHPLLNRPAPFYQGPQKLAEKLQFPVVYVNICRRRRGHYALHFELIATPPHASGSAVLDAYIERLEASIRSEPESWLWSHRRWKPPTAKEIDAGLVEAAPVVND